MDFNTDTDQLLLEIESKLDDDIVKINTELIKTKDMCLAALAKISGLIVHIDDSTATRLDSIRVSESAVKRRLYVKLALLGQKQTTVAASKKILEEVMVLGVPHYVEVPMIPTTNSMEEVDYSMNTEHNVSSLPKTTYTAGPSPVSDTNIESGNGQHKNSMPQYNKKRPIDSRDRSKMMSGDSVLYCELHGSYPVPAAVVSTFNDSCVIQIIATKLIKQVPYSSLSYDEL